MTRYLILATALLGTSASLAQERPLVSLRYAELGEMASPVASGLVYDPPPRFLPLVAGGALGGSVGYGLGFLIGEVRLDRDDRSSLSFEATIPGFWIGSTIGVMAAGRLAPTPGKGALVLIGSVFGGAFGYGLTYIASDSQGAQTVGFVLGSVLGSAAVGLLVQRHEYHHGPLATRSLLSRGRAGWSLGVPEVYRAPIADGRPARAMSLLRIGL